MALFLDIAAVRRHGAVLGLVVLLVVLALIVLLFVAWLRAKARADGAERELAFLKQAYAQLNSAYLQLQQRHPGATSQAAPPGPPSQQPPAWPAYPATPPPPPG